MTRFYFALLLLLSTAYLPAQIGVNEPNPQQALDVNGKIRVGNDNTSPDAGTIRFNSTTGTFEGYDGSEWLDLGLEKSGGLPTGPEPVIVSQAVGLSSPETAVFRRSETRTTFTRVPANKFLIITSINVLPNAVQIDENSEYWIKANPSTTSSGFGSSIYGFTITGNLGASRHIVGGQAPLIVIRPNEYMRIFRSSVSGSTINFLDVQMRGFLVDDLDY